MWKAYVLSDAEMSLKCQMARGFSKFNLMIILLEIYLAEKLEAIPFSDNLDADRVCEGGFVGFSNVHASPFGLSTTTNRR